LALVSRVQPVGSGSGAAGAPTTAVCADPSELQVAEAEAGAGRGAGSSAARAALGAAAPAFAAPASAGLLERLSSSRASARLGAVPRACFGSSSAGRGGRDAVPGLEAAGVAGDAPARDLRLEAAALGAVCGLCCCGVGARGSSSHHATYGLTRRPAPACFAGGFFGAGAHDCVPRRVPTTGAAHGSARCLAVVCLCHSPAGCHAPSATGLWRRPSGAARSLRSQSGVRTVSLVRLGLLYRSSLWPHQRGGSGASAAAGSSSVHVASCALGPGRKV